MIVVLEILAWTAVAGASALFLVGKAYFLAPFPVGRAMFLANVVLETIERRVGVPRLAQDAGLLLAIVAAISLLAGPWSALAGAVVGGAAWIAALVVDMRWRADVPARQYGPTPRVPLPIPRLIVQLRGPVLSRGAAIHELGRWPVGAPQDFELIVLNPGTVRPQLPLEVSIATAGDGIDASLAGDAPRRCPEPGAVLRVPFRIGGRRVGPGGTVTLAVRHGDWEWSRSLRIDGVVDARTPIARAEVRRWKYGAGGAFNWRGDHDLHDPSTFQSAPGLRQVLGLAARFRMPTSVMMSARLNLDQAAHEQFCRRFGWDRHSEEIPAFIRFLREEVDMRLEQEFPVSTDRPFSAEIGNHCYLHYGTHAAADPGNDWKSHAKIGEGRYPWMSSHPCDSFTEQRDNLLACSDLFETHLGFRPASYTIPSDVYDSSTARAVEAAGIEVGSETDATKLQKLLFFPRQHHPEGCERLVELTRVLPRDPVNAAQVAMLKFWVSFARRTGRAMVYLAHHHVRLYESNVCFNLTAELLRFVLEGTEGDVWCGTLTAIGRYWRDVLSERTRTIEIRVSGARVEVVNRGDRDLDGVPVEIELAGGGRFMRLVTIPAHGSTAIDATGASGASGAPGAPGATPIGDRVGTGVAS